MLTKFRAHLTCLEKSEQSISKYTHDVAEFLAWLGGREPNHDEAVEYKKKLRDHSAFRKNTVNSKISSINAYLKFLGCDPIKLLKIQKEPHRDKSKILTFSDYKAIINACGDDLQAAALVQTLGSTAFRVTELKFVTVENVIAGEAEVTNKGKTRIVRFNVKLRLFLINYIKDAGITSGPIFINKAGKTLNRSTIWRKLKSLARKAGIDERKVYPHNFRHLFATEYYRKHKDMEELRQILGHSSVTTTQLYIDGDEDTIFRHINEMEMVQVSFGQMKRMAAGACYNMREKCKKKELQQNTDYVAIRFSIPLK